MKNINNNINVAQQSYEPSSGASTKMKNALGLKHDSSVKELKRNSFTRTQMLR